MSFNPFSELEREFVSNPSPEPEELRGYYAVRLVTGILPPLRFFGHRKFFPVDVGDPEQGSGGFNEFLGKIRIGCFAIESAESILGDGQQILRINYNRPGNAFWLRPLNDELKKVGDGSYLGRGVLSLFGLTFNSFYFSVQREDRNRSPQREFNPQEPGEQSSNRPCPASRRRQPPIHDGNEAVFNKVADTMIPRGGLFETGAADYDLVPRVNDYLSTLVPVMRRLTPFMLWYVELASILFNGRRFTRLSSQRAGRFLEKMEHGRLLYHRHMILFFKLLVMTAFYEQKIPAESIGYFHGCPLQTEEEAIL